jgi:hypothetical protein
MPSFQHLNSVEKISKKFSSDFKKIHILEKDNEIKEKESKDLLLVNPVNILAKNEKVPDLFSVSMSISPDTPFSPEMLRLSNTSLNQGNLIPVEIFKNDDNKFRKEKLKQHNSELTKDVSFDLNELKNLNSSHSINFYNEFEKSEAFSMKKEEYEELERHFRESNTKVSIPPIRKQK